MPRHQYSEKPVSCEIANSIPKEEILGQLDQILDSEEFHATESQRKLLAFVIHQTVSEKSDQLKGYTIATQVFGRNKDFDQGADPIVSIQANKLRRALERYYLTAGIHDPLQIDIPKGSYIPVFYKQNNTPVPERFFTDASPMHSPVQSWPTVLVKPFVNLSGRPENDHLGIGLATEISVALSCYQEIRVMVFGADGATKRASDTPARFVVEGNVQRDKDLLSVSVHMIDCVNHVQIFAASHKTPLDPSRIIAFEEAIVDKIVLAIAGEHGAIARTMLQESRTSPPHELSTYEAILKYYEYDRFFTPEAYLAALEALTRVSQTEPDCGQVWSMLGRLHANNIVHEFFDTDVTLEQAMAYAAKGVLLNPHDQRARIILAVIKMYADDVTSARIEAEQALALNPDCLFFMDVLGYLLTLLGDWEQGPRLLNKALELHPSNHNFVHYAFWLNLFRTKDYDAAYHEVLKLSMSLHFWEPLARAATLGQMGRIKKGRQAAKELLALKPDFPVKGRRLIRYYIKFDEIIDRVVEGLGKVGVIVD